MKILDKYLIKNLLLTFLFVLFILSIITLVIDYTEKINDYVEKKVPISEIAFYYCKFIPFLTVFLFPIFVFIAVIFFTTRLTTRSEVIAMLNSGMSYRRFLQPYVLTGIALSLCLLWLNNIAIPILNKGRIAFENKYIISNPNTTRSDFHCRISPTEYIYVKGFNPTNKSGYNFAYEKIENNKLLYKLWSEQIQWDSAKKTWTLTTVQIRENLGNKETYTKQATLTRQFNFLPTDIYEVAEQKSAMTTPALQKFIDREKTKGNPGLNFLEVEKHRRSAASYSVLVLTIIGACISSKKVRGGSGIHLAIGIAISASYVVIQQFSTTFSTKGNLNPTLSVWIPNIIFTFVAWIVYRKYKV